MHAQSTSGDPKTLLQIHRLAFYFCHHWYAGHKRIKMLSRYRKTVTILYLCMTMWESVLIHLWKYQKQPILQHYWDLTCLIWYSLWSTIMCKRMLNSWGKILLEFLNIVLYTEISHEQITCQPYSLSLAIIFEESCTTCQLLIGFFSQNNLLYYWRTFRLPIQVIIHSYYLQAAVICIQQDLLGSPKTGSFTCYTLLNACNYHVCCAKKGDKTMPLHLHCIFLGWLLTISHINCRYGKSCTEQDSTYCFSKV